MLARLLFRSAENPSIPLSQADEDLYEAFGAAPSLTGIRVSRSKAMTYAALYRAVAMISADVAKLPVQVFRRLPDGGRERDPSHPASRLLRRAPNALQDPVQFFSLLMCWALLDGNAYAWIGRDGSGAPVELVPLDPQLVEPVDIDGRRRYVLNSSTGASRGLEGEDVMHIMGPGLDGRSGLSVVGLARESIGLGLAGQNYGAVFFRNSATPRVVLEHPGQITGPAQDRLRRSWASIHKGIDNAHRVAILEEGMEAKPLSVSAKDSQFLETREYQVREIAAWFGVPPSALGDPTRTSYNSLEHENQSYLDRALDPWLVRLERQLTAKLLSTAEAESDTHFVEFERNALLRTDAAGRSAYYTAAVQNGWLSIDEIRARENLNPLPDGIGDIYYRPLNLAVVGAADESAEGIEAERSEPVADATDATDATAADDLATALAGEVHALEGEVRTLEIDIEAQAVEAMAAEDRHLDARRVAQAAALVVVEDTAARIARRLARAAQRDARKPETFLDAATGEALDERHGEVIREALVPVRAVVAAALDIEPPTAGELCADLLARAAGDLARIAFGAPVGGLGDAVDEWTDRSAERLTRWTMEALAWDEDRETPGTLYVQTVILEKPRFATRAEAEAWIRANDFDPAFRGKIPDETSTSFRFRQRDPGDFVSGSFRTKKLEDHVAVVIGKWRG